MDNTRYPFELLDVPSAGTASELRRRMDQASSVRHTGWGPFVQPPRKEFEPRFIEGHIEGWIGRPVADRVARDSAHCDYWRAHPSGLFFLLRGYDEDAARPRAEPGTIIDVSIPIWRLGETLLYASRLARSYGEDPTISIRCRYTKLRNRRLSTLDLRRQFFFEGNRVCHDEVAELTTRATAAELDDNLLEILHPFLLPLYERFSFFELPLHFVRDEVTRMRANRF